MSEKTIEQIRNELADQYAKDVATDSERFFMTLAYVRGFDAAIQLCEQRERDLVGALLEIDKVTEESNPGFEQEIFEIIENAIKHRGKNDSKD